MRAVLLDALGTLVELQPPAPFLADEVATRFGVRVSGERAEAAVGAEIAYYRLHLDEGRDAQSLASLRRRCAEVVREELGLPPELDLTEALLAALRFRLYPDAEPALRALRRRGLPLVVVSNWDVSLRPLLERLGVAGMLDAVVTSAEAGARKPGAEIFRRGLQAAGVAAGEAVHVGDGLEEDVGGARAAGIEAVWLRREQRRESAPPPGVRTIASLNELPALVGGRPVPGRH